MKIGHRQKKKKSKTASDRSCPCSAHNFLMASSSLRIKVLPVAYSSPYKDDKLLVVGHHPQPALCSHSDPHAPSHSALQLLRSPCCTVHRSRGVTTHTCACSLPASLTRVWRSQAEMNFHLFDSLLYSRGLEQWCLAHSRCISFLFFLFFGHVACRILMPQPGIEPAFSALQLQSVNPWTIREVPVSISRINK